MRRGKDQYLTTQSTDQQRYGHLGCLGGRAVYHNHIVEQSVSSRIADRVLISSYR